jgi:hypothetical protein
MKMTYLFFALTLTIGFTSCSINDNELIDVEQIQPLATDPPSEGAGEKDELGPNN